MINIDINNRTPNNGVRPIMFKGVLDGALTTTLRTLDTNPMANAVGLDLVSMVAPRTYVDTKQRNKYAGAETFFREFTGTLIVCLSASYFAKAISYLLNKFYQPEVKINPNSWFSDDSLNYLNSEWLKSRKSKNYVESVLNGVSGLDGKIIRKFKDIDWNNIEWVDENRFNNYKWDNENFKNIHAKLKDKNSIISLISEIIDNKNITNGDRKRLTSILELRLTNALHSDKISVKNDNYGLSSTIHNLLRDMTDLGRDVFTNDKVDTSKAISKLFRINKVKSIGAIAIASTLGLLNQYINRKITEKRTGTQGFVGDTNYQEQIQNKKSSKDKSYRFLFERILASVGMAFMAVKVMKVKSGADFLKKLEFTGPVTGGNAIKTVYASTLIGRFLASDNRDELTETVVRDYLGFLNWLVLGGFAAKGAANILDPKRKYLFNISKEGKGIKHWLNDISLKSHNEVASLGKNLSKNNMWKLNLAQITGLAYSTTALGILLPKLNILINKKKNDSRVLQKNFNNIYFGQRIAIDDFIKK